MEEFNASQLSKNAKPVWSAAEKEAVRLKHSDRDKVFVLMTEEHFLQKDKIAIGYSEGEVLPTGHHHFKFGID